MSNHLPTGQYRVHSPVDTRSNRSFKQVGKSVLILQTIICYPPCMAPGQDDARSDFCQGSLRVTPSRHTQSHPTYLPVQLEIRISVMACALHRAGGRPIGLSNGLKLYCIHWKFTPCQAHGDYHVAATGRYDSNRKNGLGHANGDMTQLTSTNLITTTDRRHAPNFTW